MSTLASMLDAPLDYDYDVTRPGTCLADAIGREPTLFLAVEAHSDLSQTEVSIGKYAAAAHIRWIAYAIDDGDIVITEQPGDPALLEVMTRAYVVVARDAETTLEVLRSASNTSVGLRQAINNGLLVNEQSIAPLCVTAMAMLCNERPAQVAEVSVRREVEDTRTRFNQLLPRVIPCSNLDTLATHVRIGMRGVPADRLLLTQALREEERKRDKMQREFESLAGFVHSPSHTGLLTWIKRNGHHDIESTTREVMEELYATTPRDVVREVIRLHLDLSGDEVNKFRALLQHMDADNRIRHQYRFATAATGRWSSVGAQLQNLAREGKARQLICAPPGYRFFISDYAQIEPRIALWLCGHQEEHDRIAVGADVYAMLAQEIKVEREVAKKAFLAPLYGAGERTLQEQVGPDVDAPGLLRSLRQRLPKLATTAECLMEQAHAAIKTRTSAPWSPYTAVMEWNADMQALCLVLPNGRRVVYRDTKVVREGFVHVDTSGAERYVRTGWHLLNHAVQGYARDILAEAMVRLDDPPLAHVIAHTHDEVVIEVADAAVEAEPRIFQRLHALMLPFCLPPGLHLAAESRWAESLAKPTV